MVVQSYIPCTISTKQKNKLVKVFIIVAKLLIQIFYFLSVSTILDKTITFISPFPGVTIKYYLLQTPAKLDWGNRYQEGSTVVYKVVQKPNAYHQKSQEKTILIPGLLPDQAIRNILLIHVSYGTNTFKKHLGNTNAKVPRMENHQSGMRREGSWFCQVPIVSWDLWWLSPYRAHSCGYPYPLVPFLAMSTTARRSSTPLSLPFRWETLKRTLILGKKFQVKGQTVNSLGLCATWSLL